MGRLLTGLRASAWAGCFGYYAALAAVSALLLAHFVPLGPFPLRAPFSYEGDGLIFAVMVKAVAEEGPFHFERIGAPFGVDIVDWPLGMWLPLGVTALLTRLLGHAGSALNAYWLLSIVVAGQTASWAMRRLGLRPALAFTFGLLYAFLPFTFYRNVAHVNAVYPLVPLVALLALRVAGQRLDTLGARERTVLLVGCLAQGLSYVYYSFFGALLLLAAMPLGWLRTRRREPVRLGALGLLLLALGTLAPLVPSFAYWSRHGRNQSLDYKAAADADHLGLKLRHLVAPNPDHPLAAFRAVARRIEDARFPDENENVGARLGLVGSIGLMALLVFALGRSAGSFPADEDLGPPAALTLVTLLIAQVGGLGSLFSALVSPDIRAYNRIVVFLGFFALAAAGVLLSRCVARARGSTRSVRVGGWVLLAVVLALGLADQVPRDYLAAVRSRADGFAEDEAFVRLVESRLPVGAMVFQLPHATIPLDRTSRPPMGIYDPGRAYLHSRSLRWSWGSVLGRNDEWQSAVAALPPEGMVDRVVRAGFAGLWVDRWGYRGGQGTPHWTSLEARLAEATATRPEVSAGGRYAFFDLSRRAAGLLRGLGPGARAAERNRALRPFVVLRWRDGCTDEEPAAGGGRFCGPSASVVLRNHAMRGVRVRLAGSFSAEHPGHLSVAAEGATPFLRDELSLGPDPVRYEREVVVPADRRLRLDFAFDGPCPRGAAPRCWRVLELSASDSR